MNARGEGEGWSSPEIEREEERRENILLCEKRRRFPEAIRVCFALAARSNDSKRRLTIAKIAPNLAKPVNARVNREDGRGQGKEKRREEKKDPERRGGDERRLLVVTRKTEICRSSVHRRSNENYRLRWRMKIRFRRRDVIFVTSGLTN